MLGPTNSSFYVSSSAMSATNHVILPSSYCLLTIQDEAVRWNNEIFLNWRKLNSLTKASNMNHYFTLVLRQQKKYISIVRCGLYYFTVQNISAKVKEALLASNSKSHYTKCHLFQLLHFSTLQMIRKILFYWAFQKYTLYYTVHVYV